MDIKHINNYEYFIKCEDIRHKVFNLGEGVSEYYAQQFIDNKLFVAGAYIDEELVGCIYFKPFNSDCGSIDYVVVDEEYQRSDFHVGSSLIKYIEEHKEDICEYTKVLNVKKYLISPISNETEKIYMSHGYRRTKLDGTLFKYIV